MTRIVPVIMSGGSGTRLWPASRSMYPKQLLPLVEQRTMLQATALRLRGLEVAADKCLIVSNESHRFSIAEQINAVEQRARIILEPEGRNTAPAVALAALVADPDDILLVMAADHVIRDLDAFHRAVESAVDAAKQGRLVTFGVVPTHAETGYGYLKAVPDGTGAAPVEKFVEKPNQETAQQYLESGEYFWNSGMFVFRASTYLDSLKEYAPEIHDVCEKSMASMTVDGDFLRPDPKVFSTCPSDSIDYAVMEHAETCSMVSLDAGWSDIGSWAALQDVCERDADGNTLEGDAVSIDCSNTYINAESRLVAALGLRDVVIVETKDSILVASRDQAQDVKRIVDLLKLQGREETRLHRQVFRPWGSYDSLSIADQFQVKRLTVKPGAVLSLQKHAHRSEHWVVVKGKVRVTRNNEEFDLNTNESTYISIGDVHRIANPYEEPAHIIEVQCGDYLGEDDIVRLEDNYGREGTNT